MLYNFFLLNLRWVIRDRVLQAMFCIALLLLLLVPVLSSFSMQQVQELSITLSLSFISFVLLAMAILMGSSSIWRDIEKKYTTSVLTLPSSRGTYLMGKFLAISSFIAGCSVVLGGLSLLVIVVSAAQYPSTVPFHLNKYFLALAADTMKYVLLTAIGILFSSVSTSFFLPFFGSLALFVAGSASQEVFEYITGPVAKKMPVVAFYLVKAVYYVIPNFGAFDFTLQAVYPLPFSVSGFLYTSGYFIVYTSLVLSSAVWLFSRRELP